MRGEEHLTKSHQYALVYSKGSSWATNLIVMRAMPNGLPLSRYGFSVSQRVGNAVIRNKVKRRLREILREMPLKPGWDVVFIARPAAAKAEYNSLREKVESLLSQARLVESGNNSQVEVKTENS